MTMALRLTGRTIDQKVRSGPAPSIRAACSSSSGMPDMNAVKISTRERHGDGGVGDDQARHGC